LQAVPTQGVRRGSFSPDEKALVVSDCFDDRVSLCNGKTTHTVRLDGWTAYPFAFAWSPDSSRVAFCYASDGENDSWILRNGLVILNTDGKLTVVLKQEDATGTRRLWAKYVPPAWDPSGRYLYYINGVPADKNPPAAGEYVDGVYSPSAVYRFDCQAGASEFVTDGALAGFLVKENSLLLWPVPKQKEDGKWTTFAAKFSLADKKLTPLPDKIRYPRLSPSGWLVTCKGGGKVKYYRTHDWSEFGKAIDCDTDPEFWYTEFHWIVPESTVTESSSSPSSATAPAGG